MNNYYDYEKPKRPRKWIYIGAAMAFVVIVIVAVVPAVVVTNKHKQEQQRQAAGIPSYAMEESQYSNLTRVRQLNDLGNRERIFVVGDVHGCPNELSTLLDTINYNQTSDALILAGDLTTKGYDSPGVLRLAKQKGLYCVRGNHDDYVIRFKTFENINGAERMAPPNALLPEGQVTDPVKFKDEHADIAKNLTSDDYDYLVQCPMVIDLPFMNARVVHGGLDPNVNELEKNDPYTVFNIRDIDNGVPTRDNHAGEHWTISYHTAQQNKTPPIKVYYGHDASRGLDLEDVTFGLDSGCVYGGSLTALEIKTHNLTQIKCPKISQ